MADLTWPPDFYPLQGAPGALFKPEARPCSRCGSMAFLVVVQASGMPSVQCPNCCRLKPGDRVIGTLDRERWTFKANRRDDLR